MVGCYSAGTKIPCSNGALAGVFLYPTEINCTDGEQVKLQIITNAYTCDDMDYVPTEYCLDWGDGTVSQGLFPTGYGVVRNVELPHTYRYATSTKYQSTTFSPVITIKTACGGIRSVGNSTHIYCFKPGVLVPQPNMTTYARHPDFNTASCAGIFSECTDGNTRCSNGRNETCIDWAWQLNGNNPTCSDGSSTARVCDDNNTRCINGVTLSWCTQNGVGGYTENGIGACSGDEEINTCTRPCTSDFCDPTGVYYKCYGGCAVNTGITCVPETSDETVVEEETQSITDKLSNFYNNNKTLSIVGLALIGGFIMFGGKKN